MKFTDSSLPAACAATSPGRYPMDFVRLRLREDGVPVLEATDGKRLTILPLVLEDGEDYPLRDEAGDPCEILLAAGDIRAAFAKGGKTAERYLYRDELGFRIDVHGRKNLATSFPIVTQDWGTFPKIEAVIRQMEDGPEAREITVNVDLLREVLTALGDAPGSLGTTLVTLKVRNHTGPLEIIRREADSAPEARALVMPVTLEN